MQGVDQTVQIESRVEFHVPMFPLAEDDPGGVLSLYQCQNCSHIWLSEYDGAPDADCPACRSKHISGQCWTEIVRGDYAGAEARLRVAGAEGEIDPANGGTMVIASGDPSEQRQAWMAARGAGCYRLSGPADAPAIWIKLAE